LRLSCPVRARLMTFWATTGGEPPAPRTGRWSGGSGSAASIAAGVGTATPCWLPPCPSGRRGGGQRPGAECVQVHWPGPAEDRGGVALAAGEHDGRLAAAVWLPGRSVAGLVSELGVGVRARCSGAEAGRKCRTDGSSSARSLPMPTWAGPAPCSASTWSTAERECCWVSKTTVRLKKMQISFGQLAQVEPRTRRGDHDSSSWGSHFGLSWCGHWVGPICGARRLLERGGRCWPRSVADLGFGCPASAVQVQSSERVGIRPSAAPQPVWLGCRSG
jgi:hypothetical protein